jgi:hypothetical protein
MKDGKVKKCKVEFPNYVKSGEYWKVTLNHINGTYTTVKL